MSPPPLSLLSTPSCHVQYPKTWGISVAGHLRNQKQSAEGRSAHMQRWPDQGRQPLDKWLLQTSENAKEHRKVCTAVAHPVHDANVGRESAARSRSKRKGETRGRGMQLSPACLLCAACASNRMLIAEGIKKPCHVASKYLLRWYRPADELASPF